MKDKIIIKKARVHNLKDISLEIPKNEIVVFTGVSGSGKSSLAFDTIFAEGQRRYIESLSPYARQFLGEMERADVDEITGLSPAIAIDQKALSHNPRSTVGTLTEIYDYLRVLFARLGHVYCPLCNGKIEKLTVDEMVDIIVSKSKELKGAGKEKTITILSPVVSGRKGEYYQLLYDYLALGYAQARVDGEIKDLNSQLVLSRYKEHNIDIIIDKLMPKEQGRLNEAIESALNYSKGTVIAILNEKKANQQEIMLSAKWTCAKDNFSFPEVEPRLFSFNSPHGACEECGGLGKSDIFLKTTCPICHGKRLRKEALSVKIDGKNIYDLTNLPIDKLYGFFVAYEGKLNEREKLVGINVVKEIQNRLSFLLEVGLDYLSLGREAETLSGGEAQRIRLASQIGSHLSNTLYVLDEPTIGLHERDTKKLINTLKALKARNNTVIIVEHDERTINQSDYLVDLGPLAGIHGGEVVVAGELKKLLAKNSKGNSLTLQYLKGEKRIELPKRRSNIKEKLIVEGATAHNLKNLKIEVPLRKFICLTGVSGSGKSSFLFDVLYKNAAKIKGGFKNTLQDVSNIKGVEYIDNVVVMDQSPIGRTPRSNPATYTGIFTPIRDFYSLLPESRERAYTASKFSFNVAVLRGGGRCEACGGAGFKLIEMHFMAPVLVGCDVCHGKRFNREVLQVKYKKKNISDVLDMTVDEALEFFSENYLIADKLRVLQSVGLGYIKIGQSATTLSGGEAQRIKLGRELTQRLGKRTLYLLDEPTIGLHYRDIEMLLAVLNKLVDKGNTVIVIEHNLHIIKSADYIIDLGPEGGDAGGKLVAKGTPEEVANNEKSITGKHLKSYL
jgi:excinuclease ABC subunit A